MLVKKKREHKTLKWQFPPTNKNFDNLLHLFSRGKGVLGSDLWTHRPTEPQMCNFIEAVYLFASTTCYIQQTTEPCLNDDHISTIICEFSPGGAQRDFWPQRTTFLRTPAVCVYLYMCVYDHDPLGFVFTAWHLMQHLLNHPVL